MNPEPENLQKTIIILRGVSGCGKSTYANITLNLANLANQTCVICSADDYFIEKYGCYKFNPQELSQAHAFCREKFLNAIHWQESRLIIVSNTNCKENDFQFYIDTAKKNGYKVFSLVIENRHDGKNVHNVPESSLERQEENLRNSLKLT